MEYNTLLKMQWTRLSQHVLKGIMDAMQKLTRWEGRPWHHPFLQGCWCSSESRGEPVMQRSNWIRAGYWNDKWGQWMGIYGSVDVRKSLLLSTVQLVFPQLSSQCILYAYLCVMVNGHCWLDWLASTLGVSTRVFLKGINWGGMICPRCRDSPPNELRSKTE